MSAIDAVLLIAFGGPTGPAEIRPFLEFVTRGRRIPSARLEEVAHHYEQMPGGRSPLTDLTLAQARGLTRVLEAQGPALPVFVGMRNWHPFLHETLAEMVTKNVRRALGIIMSPLRSEASWDRYQRDVADAQGRTPGAPEVVFAPYWGHRRGFVTAAAERAREALSAIPAAHQAWTTLAFTAHSIPVEMADASSYVADFAALAHAVVHRIGHRRFSLTYQSRSGNPSDPWLGPDINQVLRTYVTDGERDVVVAPVGFVCDHVEVLYDLDVEARATAESLGLRFHRARAVNDHPEFVAMLADLVRGAA